MDKTFICMGSDQGEMFINLHQIVRVQIVSDDELVMHLSDGTTFHVSGEEGVSNLMCLIGQNAMNLYGEPLADMAARLKARENKIRLIKSGEAPSETTAMKTPPLEE
jgi:hypothetical protein